MSTPTFPFLRLPSNVRHNVLRNLKFDELMDISLISSNTKEMIKSLNLKVQKISLNLDDPLFISIEFSSRNFTPFYLNHNGDLSSLPCYQINPHLPKKRYTVKDYVDHFLAVLNKTRWNTLEFRQAEGQFDLNTVQELAPATAGICIIKKYSHALIKEILTRYPSAGMLKLSELNETLLEPGVFLQNFDCLILTRQWTMSLDDLLTTNCIRVRIQRSRMSKKDLNRFLKLWTVGGSPRLRLMDTGLSNFEGNQEAVLRGITHQVMEGERQFEVSSENMDDIEQITVVGGVDIRRKDGVVGTVIFDRAQENGFITARMRFFVWNRM